MTYCSIFFFLNFKARSTPYELRFHTNGLEASEGDQGNLGFCLTYQQLPCPASFHNNMNNFFV